MSSKQQLKLLHSQNPKGDSRQCSGDKSKKFLKEHGNTSSKKLRDNEDEEHALILKIKAKNKKIEGLKGKLQLYEDRIAALQGSKEVNHASTEWTDDGQHSQHYERMVRESQQISKKTLERYRRLSEQFEKYRKQAEKSIADLKKQNIDLQLQNQQLSKLMHSGTKEVKKSSSFRRLSERETNSKPNKDAIDSSWPIKESQWIAKQAQFTAKEIQWARREGELREMLREIGDRISRFQADSGRIEGECEKWRQRCGELSAELQHKTVKYRRNVKEWGQMFKEFLTEGAALGEEIEAIRCELYGQIKSELAHV